MPNVGLPKDCPPEEAKPKPGTYYRLAEKHHQPGEVAAKGSWLRPYRRGRWKGRLELCEAHALSVMDDLKDARQFREINPWAGAQALARVEIGPDDGRLLQTPEEDCDSHHDWWTNPADLYPANNIVVEGPVEVP